MTGLTETVKLIIALIIGALLLSGITYLGVLRQRAELGKKAQGTLVTTEGMQQDGAKAQEVVHRFEVDITTAAQEFEQRQSDGEQQDENVAARANNAVPVSVRDNFRQRRLARDRSQRAALERLGAPEAQDAGQREDVLR